MTIQQLKYIIGVSETGSINKAAEILYVSQPSLTAAIKDVENEFNITIFNRSSKGITLTSEGKEFIQYGRQIYAQYDNLLERFGDAGKVEIHIQPVKRRHVSEQRQDFLCRFPCIRQQSGVRRLLIHGFQKQIHTRT